MLLRAHNKIWSWHSVTNFMSNDKHCDHAFKAGVVCLLTAHVLPNARQKNRIQPCLQCCLFQACHLDSSPLQHQHFFPQSQVMRRGEWWVRTLIKRQNECPPGRLKAIGDLPRVFVTCKALTNWPMVAAAPLGSGDNDCSQNTLQHDKLLVMEGELTGLPARRIGLLCPLLDTSVCLATQQQGG